MPVLEDGKVNAEDKIKKETQAGKQIEGSETRGGSLEDPTHQDVVTYTLGGSLAFGDMMYTPGSDAGEIFYLCGSGFFQDVLGGV